MNLIHIMLLGQSPSDIKLTSSLLSRHIQILVCTLKTRRCILLKKGLDTKFLTLRSVLIHVSRHFNHFCTQYSKYFVLLAQFFFSSFKQN